tara:strand:- start:145 stop:558 length:414 start_codon:yes stop_codon:yes gene_type:complete
MDLIWQSFLAGSPVLLVHFIVTIVMLILGTSIYVWMTPHKEFQLVRGGNLAAGISLSGAILGLALPLAICMAVSVNVADIIVWGILTIAIQLLAFRLTDLVLRDLPKRIEAGEVSAATVLAAIKLSVAAINAAAVSG